MRTLTHWTSWHKKQDLNHSTNQKVHPRCAKIVCGFSFIISKCRMETNDYMKRTMASEGYYKMETLRKRGILLQWLLF